jgi:thiamine transporter
VRWGLGSGLLGGFVFGVLQFMFDGGFAIGWQSILGDYLIAIMALGLAGLFRGKKGGIFYGTVAGCFARFLSTMWWGATVWAEYMPEEFFGMTMTTRGSTPCSITGAICSPTCCWRSWSPRRSTAP